MALDYSMRISRLTVSAPMGQCLSTRAGGTVSDQGFEIQVADDGIGMTPRQVQDFFLGGGADWRSDASRGGLSPRCKRKVMGRKGVGKLAPFGFCKTIEVISAGGDRIDGGYATTSQKGHRTAHITLDCDSVVALGNEPDERYKPTVGCRDGTCSPKPGTQVILKHFNYRKVPRIDVLGRQLAQRFGIRSQDRRVQLTTQVPGRCRNESRTAKSRRCRALG